MKRLAILGASGHGKVVADIAEQLGWGEIIFYDDKWPNIKQNDSWDVIGNTNDLINALSEFDGVVVAIGDNNVRKEKYQLLHDNKAKLPNIIHPDATVSRYAVLESGIVVFAKAVINAGANIGFGCIINTGSIIEHDCVLKRFVHISPGAYLAGNITVGDLSWIGIGANLVQKINIGQNVVVGAGAVVINSIANNKTVVGSPARNLN